MTRLSYSRAVGEKPRRGGQERCRNDGQAGTPSFPSTIQIERSLEKRPAVCGARLRSPLMMGFKAAADIIRQNVEAGADTYVNVDNH